MDYISTLFYLSQFHISLAVSSIFAFIFIFWQRIVYCKNKKAINNLSHFFAKKEGYSTLDYFTTDEETKKSGNVIIKDVAEKDAELKNLINDINNYINKSRGTVAFSIIQNKTERRISMLYEIATSKLSFPTHIGLMGTFAGVFLGLLMFLLGTYSQGEITDSTIQSLICGVLVSMITSFFGIWMLILSHKHASDATNQIDKDKNEFYEWVQNELMPTVDVSIVEAIGKLHYTIDKLEPTFTGVINQFKDAFKDVTGAFGNDFRDSVTVITSSVEHMGRNIDKINQNIQLQEKLLLTVRSNQFVKGIDAFVVAASHFSEITNSLNKFEESRKIMLETAIDTIAIQKDFNESLQIPKQVAEEINSILNRITTFENNIEGLGENIAQTQLVGNTLVEQIKQNLIAINSKQRIAEQYADTANEQLEEYLERHKVELGVIAQKYNEALDHYLSDYENMLVERKEELEKRKCEFIEAIDQKFSLDEIRTDFSSLSKLNEISQNIDFLKHGQINEDFLNRMLNNIVTELNSIKVIQDDYNNKMSKKQYNDNLNENKEKKINKKLKRSWFNNFFKS